MLNTGEYLVKSYSFFFSSTQYNICQEQLCLKVCNHKASSYLQKVFAALCWPKSPSDIPREEIYSGVYLLLILSFHKHYQITHHLNLYILTAVFCTVFLSITEITADKNKTVA